MEQIDEHFILRTDNKLADRGVPLYARPIGVAVEWLKEKRIAGEFLDPELQKSIMKTYYRLYPNGDFDFPQLFTGGVLIRDQVYQVGVNVGYGAMKVEPLKLIDISKAELEIIFQHYPEQGWQAFYGACDALDFGYGMDDLIKIGTPAADLLRNACASLVASFRILKGTTDVDTVVQTACLAAELSMKALLLHVGKRRKFIRSLSHNLPDLAKAVVDCLPSTSDARLLTAASKFPDYVGTRYSTHGLTRIGLGNLAMRAQFIAADCVRRLSDRNIADSFEQRDDCPSRPEL